MRSFVIGTGLAAVALAEPELIAPGLKQPAEIKLARSSGLDAEDATDRRRNEAYLEDDLFLSLDDIVLEDDSFEYDFEDDFEDDFEEEDYEDDFEDEDYEDEEEDDFEEDYEEEELGELEPPSDPQDVPPEYLDELPSDFEVLPVEFGGQLGIYLDDPSDFYVLPTEFGGQLDGDSPPEYLDSSEFDTDFSPEFDTDFPPEFDTDLPMEDGEFPPESSGDGDEFAPEFIDNDFVFPEAFPIDDDEVVFEGESIPAPIEEPFVEEIEEEESIPAPTEDGSLEETERSSCLKAWTPCRGWGCQYQCCNAYLPYYPWASFGNRRMDQRRLYYHTGVCL